MCSLRTVLGAALLCVVSTQLLPGPCPNITLPTLNKQDETEVMFYTQVQPKYEGHFPGQCLVEFQICFGANICEVYVLGEDDGKKYSQRFNTHIKKVDDEYFQVVMNNQTRQMKFFALGDFGKELKLAYWCFDVDNSHYVIAYLSTLSPELEPEDLEVISTVLNTTGIPMDYMEFVNHTNCPRLGYHPV